MIDKYKKIYNNKKKYAFDLLREAVVVGLSLTIINILLSNVLNIKNYIIMSFIGGTGAHLLFEFFRINKYYCNYGAACVNY